MKEKGISKIAILTGNDGFGASGKKQLEELAKPKASKLWRTRFMTTGHRPDGRFDEG